MESKVKQNQTALRGYIASMQCAIDKAMRGSDAEDMYFVEKLEKMANRLGYDLVTGKDNIRRPYGVTLQAMITDTQQHKEALLKEMESCQDCIYALEQELSKKG